MHVNNMGNCYAVNLSHCKKVYLKSFIKITIKTIAIN